VEARESITRIIITSGAIAAQRVEKRHTSLVIFINGKTFRELAPQRLHVAIDSGLV